MSLERNVFLGEEINELRAQKMEELSKYFDLCFSVNRLASDFRSAIVVDRDVTRQVLCACLFQRLHENYQAAVLLLTYGLPMDSKIIVRTLWEGLYNLRVITKDKKATELYIKYGEKLRLEKLRKALSKDRPFVKENNHSFTKEELNQFKDFYEEIKSVDIKIAALAKDAGLADYHVTLYSLLSDVAHCSPRVLDSYLVLDEQDRVVDIKWGPNWDKDYRFVVTAAAEGMLFVLESINQLFGLRKENELSQLNKDVDEIAKEMLQEVKPV
ncbi:MAG: hypothetical protein KQI62_13480 [Deltaproteobacteria bacterium]|nr:hypothetical protein [Deltaproteobacteria bacterium]